MKTSILTALALTASLAATRASAKDWFVRAGADGDGSLERPFSDPWQALDVVEAGDVIHVAGGKYFGQLGAGMWETWYVVKGIARSNRQMNAEAIERAD